MANTNTQYTDKEVEEKWMELRDIPFDYPPEESPFDDMTLGEDWFLFEKGTERNEIWRWFNAHHSKGVSWLLYESELC